MTVRRADPYEPGYYILDGAVYEVRLSGEHWYAMECDLKRWGQRHYVGKVGNLRADCKLLPAEVKQLTEARII